MKVLCIGKSSWDITVPVDEFPKENENYRYEERYASGGGDATNSAYLLGKWGIDTVVSTSVGSDDFGTNIKKEFQDVNVRVDYIETNYDKSTSLSYILVNKNNKARTILNVTPERPILKKINYDFTPDYILTDGYDYGASQSAMSKNTGAMTILAAKRTDPEILELCKYAKVIIANQEFAEKITGVQGSFENPQSLVDLFTRLQNKYPNSNIIITMKEHGALYQDGNQVKIMPGLKLEIKDTTGAGDIFRGAFLYSLVNNFNMDKAISIANIAAGLSCTKYGARLAIPSLSEVLEYYTKQINGNNPIPEQNQNQVPPQVNQPVQNQVQGQ